MLQYPLTFHGGLDWTAPFPSSASLQESTIKTSSPKKPSKSTRPVLISSLAAKLLGHSRVAPTALSARHMSVTFPAFNSQELENAVSELVDKQLLTQKGNDAHATYSLTEYGREGRVAVD